MVHWVGLSELPSSSNVLLIKVQILLEVCVSHLLVTP